MDSTLGLGASYSDPYFWITGDVPPHDSDTCIERDCADCAALKGED